MKKTELVKFLEEQSENHKNSSETAKAEWLEGYERGLATGFEMSANFIANTIDCLLYTSPSPRDRS